MPHMKWPPQVIDIKNYGEVKDVSGRHLPRDIGRPVYLGGNTYYIFGDTFCHDKHKQFCGIADNTLAYVPDPIRHPTQCQYLDRGPYHPPFIPHTGSEQQYETAPQNKTENRRVVNWSFGGIIEDSPGSRTGWIFFEKSLTYGAEIGKFFGTGVARVSVREDRSIEVSRDMGDTLVFGENEPHFGAATHLCEEDGFVYLLGSKDPPPPTLDLHNHWARIRRDADFRNRDNYEFLLENGQWSKQYQLNQLRNIIPVQAQGSIIKDPELGPEGRPYLWFGVNKFCANRLYVACAPQLAGPWEEWEGPELPPFGGGGLRYCLYPHERSCKPREGEMLISWSDNANAMGGMVVQGMFKFAMEGGGAGFDGGQEQNKEKGHGFRRWLGH